MRIKVENDLLIVAILALLPILIITFSPSSTWRLILGLPLVLFLPGYTLLAALFPKKGNLSPVERIGLGFGLSIAVVSMTGLMFNYTPWGIGLYPVLFSVTLFVLAMVALAWYRRGRLVPRESFKVTSHLALPGWRGDSTLDKALSIVLALSILGAIVTLVYVVATPKTGEKFTEFYVLGTQDKAEGYPLELAMGEEATVLLGIVNHEYQEQSYRLEVKIDGVKNREVGLVVLSHGQKWEQEVGFVPSKPGNSQKVEFLLYNEGESQPYVTTHLWINVAEGG